MKIEIPISQAADEYVELISRPDPFFNGARHPLYGASHVFLRLMYGSFGKKAASAEIDAAFERYNAKRRAALVAAVAQEIANG